MIGLIGSTGMLGGTLQQQTQFDKLYNTTNIDQITNTNFDLLVVSAPSADRRWANTNAHDDLINIKNLIDVLTQVAAEQVILLSTIDALAFPDTPYGANRKFFSEQVLQLSSTNKVIYLAAPIGDQVKKGLLYDLKNQQFLDSIDAGSVQQYTPLEYLWTYINMVRSLSERSYYFFSEPVATAKILDEFFPDMEKKYSKSPVRYDFNKYQFTSAFIFEQMQKYFRIVV